MAWRCLSWLARKCITHIWHRSWGRNAAMPRTTTWWSPPGWMATPGSSRRNTWGPPGSWRPAMRGGGLGLPDRTGHREFGAAAAAWGVLEDLGVAAVIDEVAGAGPSGLPLSAGTYLVLAALNRLVAPCSKLAFADWRKTPARSRCGSWKHAGWMCPPSPWT